MEKAVKKIMAGLLSITMVITMMPGLFSFAAEPAKKSNYLGVARKSQYVLYAGAEQNAMQLNGKNYIVNGNVHANSDIGAYLDTLDVRGKLETTGKVLNYNNGVTSYIKKENIAKRVLIDPKDYIYTSLGFNGTVHENW